MLLPQFSTFSIEAGVDEAGRGCLAGPVVAAAVILPVDFDCPMLNDSKQLSHKARVEAKEIIEKQAIAFYIAEVSAERIDEINILQATFEAMHLAINGLSVTPEYLAIDGNRFRKHDIPHTSIIKGDGKYQHIAAASVLAKTYRDKLMEEWDTRFPVYDWKNNKGYPTLSHKKAIALHGHSPFHRLTFRWQLSEDWTLF